MNEIQKFDFNENHVRVMVVDGQTEWVASDVAKALGYKDATNAIKRHCRVKGVAKRHTLTSGGVQKVMTITEPNLYRLIAHSKLPSAQKFESWVFEEVLPSIRKNGGYINPAANEEAVSALIEKWTAERVSLITTIAEQAVSLAITKHENGEMAKAVSLISPKYPFGTVSKATGRRKTKSRRAAWCSPRERDAINLEAIQLLLPLFQRITNQG